MSAEPRTSKPKRKSEPLTQTKIDALKPKAKPYKIADGGGLHLLVTPNGSKLWRLSYRHAGKQKTLALGVYEPKANGLEEARAERSKARLALKAGRDPARTESATTASDTFEDAARAWHREQAPDWSPKYAGIVLKRMEDYIFPDIGQLPLGSVRTSDVKRIVAALKQKGLRDTARRVQQYIGAVCRNTDDEKINDPTARLRAKRRKGQIKAEVQRHHKKLKRGELGKFLTTLDASQCEPHTRLAILLTIFTAARTNEIIGARWSEFENLRTPAKALWRVPAVRMKEGREHLVPLSSQALAVLKELQAKRDIGSYVFPGRGGYGSMSNNTMLFHCYAMGYHNKTTMHGFRGSFSTIANESGLWSSDVIELCLAHLVGGDVRRAYNSAQHLPKRRELLQWWGDELTSLKATAARVEALLG